MKKLVVVGLALALSGCDALAWTPLGQALGWGRKEDREAPLAARPVGEDDGDIDDIDDDIDIDEDDFSDDDGVAPDDHPSLSRSFASENGLLVMRYAPGWNAKKVN